MSREEKEINNYLVKMDWSAFPFVEYFLLEKFPKWEDWKLYYLDVVDLLQMSEDQAMASTLGVLRG